MLVSDFPWLCFAQGVEVLNLKIHEWNSSKWNCLFGEAAHGLISGVTSWFELNFSILGLFLQCFYEKDMYVNVKGKYVNIRLQNLPGQDCLASSPMLW